MNFFRHQERARRNSLVLVGLFVLAVLVILIAVNLLLGVFLGLFWIENGNGGSGTATATGWGQRVLPFALLSLGTLVVIGGASAFRIVSLSQGGGKVAELMDGRLIPPDTTDFRERRLRNIVEEMALASGIPAPDVYVLDGEDGINAFAAGYTPADAAVAVTRGTLDTLSRDELQGVVAHEYSHILNGDMRLNIRLMGALFGILVITVVGRWVLLSARRRRFSSSGRNKNRAGNIAMGLGLIAIGYIGILFGRLIKAALSRQREYFADASAVQFTRNPVAVTGALKAIGATSAGAGGVGSRLAASETEEVSHMLFADGLGRRIAGLFATHPPLTKRIRAIEPHFDPAELDEVRRRLERRREAAETAEKAEAAPEPAGGAGPWGGLPGAALPGESGGAIPGSVLTGAVLADLERPGGDRLAEAADLLEGLPPVLLEAAHDRAGAVPLVLALLLIGDEAALRQKRTARIAEIFGDEAAARLAPLLDAAAGLEDRQRLPLVELTMPALRHQPRSTLERLPALIREVAAMDGRISVFEYAIGLLVGRHVEDFLKPGRAGAGGRQGLEAHTEAAADLLAILAHHGARHGTRDEAGGDRTEAAFTAGLDALGLEHRPPYRPREDWIAPLDSALARLDALTPAAKERLVTAMVATVTHDDRVTVTEAELLRALCGRLHIPAPPVAAPSKQPTGGVES